MALHSYINYKRFRRYCSRCDT